MLEGVALDDNPLLVNQAADKILEIIYQDNDMLVVNKPPEFLSVPGKDIQDSVYQRIKSQFPQATGSLIVHRLDMSTSGLMVIALNPAAHKNLQRQFIQRSVKKTYVAVVAGLLTEDSGTINLPLRGNLYDRPRQVVCHEHGKSAITHWQVMARDEANKQTKLLLQPHTGRTHQLRVHCAHHLGLNMAIVGDDLYGKTAERLHLHAQRLALFHPVSEQWLEFEVDPEF
jgi:tRNA pseudouridine32 synthase/23S rRNA pseudouridine746 synthase